MSAHWLSSTPFTYEIGYEKDHVGNDAYAEKVAAGKPGILHTGHDVALNSTMGNTVQFHPENIRYVSPDNMPARIEELRAFVRRMHEAGARRVIPYLITMLLIGNPDERTGFWHFYDRWDEFSFLGLGPKPDTDPIEWLQKAPVPFEETGLLACETTISHPAVRQFLSACVALVAKCGYDGVFLDVNTMIGTTEHDARWFHSYLALKYSESELKRLFGFSALEDVRLGAPGDGLLWVETQRFRSWAFGQLFSRLRDVGRAHNPQFIVVPNNSPLSTISGFYNRRFVGHGLLEIADNCDIVMYEEMQQPGRFGLDRIYDNILQYKTALAHNVPPCVLLYHATDATAVSLANAEAAAGGGGGFVQPGFGQAGTMRMWGEWFARHEERYDNLLSLHDVGVVFVAEEMYWDNREHVEAVYRIRQALSDNHVLFDLIVDPDLPTDQLASFPAIIVPELHHLSEQAAGHLLRYAAEGGQLIVVGKSGAFDERGKPRKKTVREELASSGHGALWVDRLDALVPKREGELFDLTEDQYNDTNHIMSLPERVSSVAEAQEARRVQLLTALELLVKRPVRVLAEPAPYTLRVSAFATHTKNHTIVHLVNYDVPVMSNGHSGEPIPAQEVRVRLPAREARWWTPDGIDGEPLRIEAGEVVVPEVRMYAMAELRSE